MNTIQYLSDVEEDHAVNVVFVDLSDYNQKAIEPFFLQKGRKTFDVYYFFYPHTVLII